MSFRDFAADLLGIAAGTALVLVLQKSVAGTSYAIAGIASSLRPVVKPGYAILTTADGDIEMGVGNSSTAVSAHATR